MGYRGQGAGPFVHEVADAALHTIEGLSRLAHFAGTGFGQGRGAGQVAAEIVRRSRQAAQGAHDEVKGQQADKHKEYFHQQYAPQGKVGDHGKAGRGIVEYHIVPVA